MRLSAQQEALERYLATGDSVIPSELLVQIQGSNTLPAADGLMIYNNAYRARLLSVMREDFPALHRWLGDESFEQLALAYISAWPPRHFSLRWLGEKLPEFVSGYIAEPQRSPMLELATLEWAFTLAFDAPDAVPLSLDVMGSFSADDWVYLRVCLIPSVRWLQLQHNTLGMWVAAKAEADIPAAVALSAPWIAWFGGMSWCASTVLWSRVKLRLCGCLPMAAHSLRCARTYWVNTASRLPSELLPG